MKKILCISVMIPLLSGCAAYNKHVAPHIPDLKAGFNIGGSGFGAQIGIDSRWNEETGERERELYLEKDE